jgi:hypothetical protein
MTCMRYMNLTVGSLSISALIVVALDGCSGNLF